MQAVSRPSNRLLQVLPAPEFQSLCPHLESVELAKGSVLSEAGVPPQHVSLPQSGVVSMMVSLSEGQTVEVAREGAEGADRFWIASLSDCCHVHGGADVDCGGIGMYRGYVAARL